MKPVHLLLVGILLASAATGQTIFFISIDSDERELFRVTVGKKTYSSDGFGHLVIPHLIDSTYSLKIEFLSGKYDEHIFSVEMDHRDRGFQMKKRDARNWVLFDWQRLELLNTVQNEKRTPNANEGRRTDEFARLMAAVVNDSSVLILSDHSDAFRHSTAMTAVPTDAKKGAKMAVDSVLPVKDALGKGVIQKEFRKPDTLVKETGTSVSTQTSGSVTANEQVIRKDTESVGQAEDVIQGRVKKIQDKTDIAFRSQLFRDSSVVGVDSILIKIPLDVPAANQNKILPAAQPSAGWRDTSLNAMKSIKDTAVKSSRLVMINSDCRFFATDEDVDKLRVKMMETEESGVRIEAARRGMRNRCFSTKQVRSLTELFSNDESRYRYFEAVYPYVSDTDAFRELIVFLTDEYFKARFKALVRY